MITGLTRYGLSNADAILASVVTAFDVEVVSEHEPEYWGFETQEEWDAWQHEVGRESWHVFYKELLAVIRGEPNTFSAGTLGAIYARLAQKLAKQEPALLRAENETAFMEKLGEMYLDEKALGFPADKQEAPF